jgi:hypothetical protein
MTGPGEKFDYLLKGMKSRVENTDTRVKTEESRVETNASRAERLEHTKENEEMEPKVNTLTSRVDTIESRVESLDYIALDEAIEEANKKPKLGVYSPLAAAMLRYKAITTPRYSMGSELRIVIEQALKESYPQLYDEVQKRMREG